jgi:NADPH:quinone reductase-like Zn-dependent oxidoreductase
VKQFQPGDEGVRLIRLADGRVTGVCSTKNVDLVRSISADHVVDYTNEDFKERP